MRLGYRRNMLLLIPVLVAALLRVYPMHRPFLGLELQELYPSNAVIAVAKRNWEPFALHHGGAMLTVLRATFTAWYAIGSLAGLYEDRVDLLAHYVRNDFPFVLTGRAIVLACALASVYLVARLGTRLAGVPAGVAGGFFLAVSFIHVRESHHVWLEVPAGAAVLAAVTACLRAAETGRLAAIALAGAASGVAIASKLSTFSMALPFVLAAWLGAAGRPALALRRLLIGGALAVAAFVVLSPYTMYKLRETLELLARLQSILFGNPGESLTLGTCVRQGLGIGVCGLAIVGLVTTAYATPRQTAIVAAFPIGYSIVVATATVLYARYLAVLAPFAALFAGAGAAALTRALPAGRHVALALVVLGAGASQAFQSFDYDRLLARRDTRQLAADWIRAHVTPGTTLTVPNMVPYLNPTLPPDAQQLRLQYGAFAPALQARGLGDPERTYPMHYLGFFQQSSGGWEPIDRIVVTAEHPVVMPGWGGSPEQLARLEAAGARVVARFDGFTDPLQPSVVFEPIEADYVPLSGFETLIRPGPNLTIWRVPERKP